MGNHHGFGDYERVDSSIGDYERVDSGFGNYERVDSGINKEVRAHCPCNRLLCQLRGETLN